MSDVFQSLTFKEVHLGFENQEVLRCCDFDFPLGQNLRIVFENDKQKFFFFHALTQVEGFVSGQYLMNDQDVTQMSFEEFLPYRLKMGFGFSTRGLIHNRTLRQNLELPLRYHNLFSESELVTWLKSSAEYFELEKDLDKRPAEVSPNSQKATLVLRAFIHRPELVILDTPEMMLSTKLQANLLQLIDDHRKNFNLRHLIFSTYDESLSDCLTDKNILMRKKSLELIEVNKLQKDAS